MALMAVLLGIGLGAMSRPLPDSKIAVQQVQDSIRGARSFAMMQQSPSFVVMQRSTDEENARLISGGRRVVGQWHFESPDYAGFPNSATVVEGDLVPKGVIGSALELDGEKNSFVELGDVSAFNAVDGVELELFVRVEDESKRTLLQKGDAYGLRQVGRELEFSVLIPTKKPGLSRPEKIEDVRLISPPTQAFFVRVVFIKSSLASTAGACKSWSMVGSGRNTYFPNDKP